MWSSTMDRFRKKLLRTVAELSGAENEDALKELVNNTYDIAFVRAFDSNRSIKPGALALLLYHTGKFLGRLENADEATCDRAYQMCAEEVLKVLAVTGPFMQGYHHGVSMGETGSLDQ